MNDTITRWTSGVVVFVIFPVFLSRADEYRYPLTTTMRTSSILTTARPMKWREVVAGFTLGTGSSSNPKLEHSAGICGSLGIISEWVSTRWSYATEGTQGELILYPLKTEQINLAIGVGGQYFRETIHPFYTLYCSRSFDTMAPYAALRQGTSPYEVPLSDCHYPSPPEQETLQETTEHLTLALGLDYTGLETTGLMFEFGIIPEVETSICYCVDHWEYDTSYVYHEISEEKAKNIMKIAISGYMRF